MQEYSMYWFGIKFIIISLIINILMLVFYFKLKKGNKWAVNNAEPFIGSIDPIHEQFLLENSKEMKTMQTTIQINEKVSLTLEIGSKITPKDFVELAETVKRITKQEGLKRFNAKPKKVNKKLNRRAQSIALGLMLKGRNNKEINKIMKKKGYTKSRTFASDARYQLRQRGYKV